MFDKLGQLKDLWQLKNQIAEIKKRLDNMVIKVSSPNHIFEITINGSQEVQEITVTNGIDMFPREKWGAELKEAFNKAIHESQALAAQAMGGAMGADLPKA